METQHGPLTRAENRVITQTGTLASGNQPSTYAEKGVEEPTGAVSDLTDVQAPTDEASTQVPGPSSAAAV
jgi:hypothetical protein